MANELKHEDVGGELSRAEWEGIGTHVLDAQATGDIIYASSVTQLSRLGIGAANAVLHVAGGVPVWAATLAGLTLTSPTINGTIATTGLTLPAFTLGGLVTINGQVFDAGAGQVEIDTTGAICIYGKTTQDGPLGVVLRTYHVSTTPAANDVLFRINARGRNSVLAEVEYFNFNFLIENVTNGTEAGKLQIYAKNAGAFNEALNLSSAGILRLDHSVMFDQDVDSALVADQVSISGYEIAPGQRSLAISQENPVVVEAVGASDRTLPVRVNGATLKIMLHT